MKFNSLQQLATILYGLIFLIFFVFFIPFKDNGDLEVFVVYDVIWSNHFNIDIARLLVEFVVFLIVFVFTIKYFERFNSLQKNEFKRIFKRELLLLIIFLFINIGSVSYLFLNNLFNEGCKNRYLAEIKLASCSADTIQFKLNVRAMFWSKSRAALKNIFYSKYEDVQDINQDVPTYFNCEEIRMSNQEFKRYFDLSSPYSVGLFWGYLIKNIHDDAYIADFYSCFADYELYMFKVESPIDLRNFVIDNQISNEDFSRLSNLKREIGDLQNKISKLKFYDSSDLKQFSLTLFAVTFAFFYVLRLVILFIRAILKDIK